MQITLLQTADAQVYSKMLAITGRTAIDYAAKHDCHYKTHVGVMRGFFPWQATFNRIMLIDAMLRNGETGWVLYLDADSYIASLTFDLREFLGDKADVALIAAASGAEPRTWWNVNDGVFALNLDHPRARDIVSAWLEKFMDITDADLKRAYTWNMITGGQALLQEVLAEDEGLEKVVYIDATSSVINSPNAVFVRQVLRAEGNIGYRMKKLAEDIAGIFEREGAEAPPTTILADAAACNEEFMRAIYTCVLLREPDSEGHVAALERLSNNSSSYAKELTTFLRSEEFGRKLPIILQVFQGTQDFDELIGVLTASHWRREARPKEERDTRAIAIEQKPERTWRRLLARLPRS